MDEKPRLRAEGSCSQFEMELGGYLEGESKPFVLAHTRECGVCRAVLEDLEQIRTLARELPLEEPSPAVWANVRSQLIQEGLWGEKLSRWTWLRNLGFVQNPVPVGALAGLVILGAFLSLPPKPFERRGTEAVISPSPAATLASMSSPMPNGDLTSTVRNLESTYRANEKYLAPETKATYEKSLNSLNNSIRECLEFLQQEPNDALTNEYLMAAYSRKAEVLASALEFQGR